MTLNESIIKNSLKAVFHPTTKQPIINYIEKIIINNDEIFFSIFAEGLAHDVIESLIADAKNTLTKNGINNKVHISATNQLSSPKKNAASKQLPVSGVNKIIMVASGKGGVGKSTVAFNLAITLANEGYSVGLVDADIYGPSLPTLSGLNQRPILENDLMIPHEKFGIKMMSIGFLVDQNESTVWRGPMTSKVLYQLMRMTKWADRKALDFLIVDTPPGTGDVHLSLAENYKVDGVVIVTTPQKLAISDAIKSIDMYHKVHIPVLGIVENMAYIENPNGDKQYIFGKDGVKELAKKYDLAMLASLPLQEQIASSTASIKPFAFYDENSNASQALKTASAKLVELF